MERIKSKPSGAFARKIVHNWLIGIYIWMKLFGLHISWIEGTNNDNNKKLSAKPTTTTKGHSLHHHWVQPYWLESSEDPKIFHLINPPLCVESILVFALPWSLGKICSPGFPIGDSYSQTGCQQFEEKPKITKGFISEVSNFCNSIRNMLVCSDYG